MQEWKVEQPWLDARCELAEGPFYEKSSDSLRFIDIKKKQICWVRNVSAVDSLVAASTDGIETIQLDVPPGVTADIDGIDPKESILVGLKKGLAILKPRTGKYEVLTPFHDVKTGGEPNDRLRANDGAADPKGDFFLGTMTDFGMGPFQPEGMNSFFSFFMDIPKTVIPKRCIGCHVWDIQTRTATTFCIHSTN